MKKKNKILVIIGDDKSSIKVSESILKYLNSLNKNNEYYFLIMSNAKNLKKISKKNVIKTNFSQFQKKLKKNDYDWLLSIWSAEIYNKEFLSKFKKNLNLHPSYLPFNRGKDPYCWSIYDRTPMGVTIHEMNEKIDKGRIYIRKKISLSFPISAYQVYLSSLNEIKNLFIKNWLKIKQGKIKLKKIKYSKRLNFRKEYIKHTFLDLDKNNNENKIIKKFIYKILSCDFSEINSLKIKLNKKIFETKIDLNKKIKPKL
mgnify:CR=1 FL=1|tara:strand:+ start:2323 stop:3093 length:771 start_codon:yes stop_codon:yes gene_type:complete